MIELNIDKYYEIIYANDGGYQIDDYTIDEIHSKLEESDEDWDWEAYYNEPEDGGNTIVAASIEWENDDEDVSTLDVISGDDDYYFIAGYRNDYIEFFYKLDQLDEVIDNLNYFRNLL